MKKLYLSILVFASLLCSSCNDWLDVKGETEAKEEDLFQKENGFYSALTGCYMGMANRDLYGERLTMSNIESLGNLWYMPNNSWRKADLFLTDHNYKEKESREALDIIYNKLFNVVTQVNALLRNLEKTGDVIEDPAVRAIIEGEAYALRAYCQLDILRLFGQMPNNAGIQVQLPYSETATIDTYPPYYDFAGYVQKLENDLTQAETLLKDNDPLFSYTFDKLCKPSEVPTVNSFLYYRQLRMNYWAVRALRARLCLYKGDNAKAHEIALELINAKGADGQPLRPLNSVYDYSKEFYAAPSECLFAMSKYDLADYSVNVVWGSEVRGVDANQQLVIRQSSLNDLYAGQNITSHNRYLKMWNREATDSQSYKYGAIKKYDYDEKSAMYSLSNPVVNLQIIPMLRMSEMYLIAMETSNDLAEVNRLYTTYMADRNVLVDGDYFTSLTNVKPEIINEYRREFFGEGVMFYVYKRTNATQMMWRNPEVSESEYLLPVPETEFNPNDMNK